MNMNQYHHWAHPFFRASFPNLVVLVNHWWDVAGHPKDFPKWYMLNYRDYMNLSRKFDNGKYIENLNYLNKIESILNCEQ